MVTRPDLPLSGLAHCLQPRPLPLPLSTSHLGHAGFPAVLCSLGQVCRSLCSEPVPCLFLWPIPTSHSGLTQTDNLVRFGGTLSQNSWHFPTLNPFTFCFLIRYLKSILPVSLRLRDSSDQPLFTIIYVHIDVYVCVCTCICTCVVYTYIFQHEALNIENIQEICDLLSGLTSKISEVFHHSHKYIYDHDILWHT